MEQKKTQNNELELELNMEEFFENRPDFQPMNITETLEVIKDEPKPKKLRIRVEKGIEYLIEKETGELYKIVVGKIPTEKERVKRDITASMLTLEPANGGEQRLIMLGYTLDGKLSEANKFEIYKEQGENNDQGTSTTTN